MADLPWWHTIDVAPGLATPGSWDLRGLAPRLPWPSPSLAGRRCLDVGTRDGFWAFEMERRRATDVVGIDLPGVGASTFAAAAAALDFRARRVELDLHDLDPADVGTFDLVVVGYVLGLVRDPLGALEAVRRVCARSVVVLDVVSLGLCLLPSLPSSRLAARGDGDECFVFNRRGLRRAVELAGFEVEEATGLLAPRPGPAAGSWRLPRRRRVRNALILRSVAVRARAP